MRTAHLPTIRVLVATTRRGVGAQVLCAGELSMRPSPMSGGVDHPTMWPIPWCVTNPPPPRAYEQTPVKTIPSLNFFDGR